MNSEIKALVAQAICFVLLLSLYCIEPFWRIRIARIREGRIGHLAMNTDALLRRWQIDGRAPRTAYLFITSGGRAANDYLLGMWKATLPVVPESFLAITLRKFIQIYPNSRFHYDMVITSTEYREFALANRSLFLPKSEQNRGAAELERLGIGKDRWLVGFGNRDPAYLVKHFPNIDWAYHSCRDSSTQSYLKAMQEVRRRGGVAVRMGAARHYAPASSASPWSH
jgi:hypothetical protein